MNPPEPIAFVKRITDYHGGYIIWVDCPFCAKEHSHGDMDICNKYDFGTRMSHCFKRSSKEYRIILKRLPEYEMEL